MSDNSTDGSGSDTEGTLPGGGFPPAAPANWTPAEHAPVPPAAPVPPQYTGQPVVQPGFPAPYAGEPGVPPHPGYAAQPPAQPGQYVQPQYPQQNGGQYPHPGQPVLPQQYAGQPQYPAPGQPPYGAPGQPYPGMPAGQQPGEPTRPRRPRWPWFVGGGVAAALVIGLGVVLVTSLLGGGGGSATSVADAYVEALNSGDIEGANELARLDPTVEGNEFLTSEVAAAADAGISKVEIVDSVAGEGKDEDKLFLTLRYDVGATGMVEEITVSKDDEGWFVSDGVARVLEPMNGSTALSNAVTIPGSTEVFDLAASNIVLYPGNYHVEAPTEFFEIGTPEYSVFTVGGEFMRSMPFPRLVPTQALIDAIAPQVAAHFEACASRVLQWSELKVCGINPNYHTAADESQPYELTVQIVEMPTVTLPEGDPSSFSDLYAISYGAFALTVAGVDSSGAPLTEVIPAKAWSVLPLRSYVDFVDGKAVLTIEETRRD